MGLCHVTRQFGADSSSNPKRRKSNSTELRERRLMHFSSERMQGSLTILTGRCSQRLKPEIPNYTILKKLRTTFYFDFSRKLSILRLPKFSPLKSAFDVLKRFIPRRPPARQMENKRTGPHSLFEKKVKKC